MEARPEFPAGLSFFFGALARVLHHIHIAVGSLAREGI